MANRYRTQVLTEKACTKCKEVQPIENFPLRSRKTGSLLRTSECQSCRRKAVRDRRRAKTEWLQAYKLERGCTDCGYNAHPAALEFDHLPEFIKLFNVGEAAASKSLKLIQLEVAKCEIVCANCHAIRTERRRNGE